MSASTAIGMVSASLRNLLAGEMRFDPAVDVTVLAPDESSTDTRVNLFLYRVQENPFLANQDALALPGNKLVPPPLSLSLFYLLTVFAPEDSIRGNITAHEILGEAMRVLRRYAILPRSSVEQGLADAREHLQVASAELAPDELSRIWASFAQPFRLSVAYQVSTVQLDVEPTGGEHLPARVRTIGVPAVQQASDPPVITEMAPERGRVGTTVSFAGCNFTGRPVSVSMGGRTLPDATVGDDRTVTATIPAALDLGVYNLVIDISSVCRRTFLFEVTT
ncbi:MAG: DUF4255 domain-containing protein [Pseudonocardia sp.]|nr:MAG: DUF4255 domain-containing protein [Pseudonocardia sp.]